MDRATIRSKVFETVAETLEIDEGKLSESSRFSDLGADSLDLLELATEMENVFGTMLDDDELVKIETIGDVVDAIQNA